MEVKTIAVKNGRAELAEQLRQQRAEQHEEYMKLWHWRKASRDSVEQAQIGVEMAQARLAMAVVDYARELLK